MSECFVEGCSAVWLLLDGEKKRIGFRFQKRGDTGQSSLAHQCGANVVAGYLEKNWW